MLEPDKLQALRERSSRFWADNRFVVLGLLAALVVLEIVVAYTIGKEIESTLRTETASKLTENGLYRVEPSASGRDLILEGEVSSEIARELAMDIAESVDGVRIVGTTLEIVPMRLPHIRMTRPLDGSLHLEGELPTLDLVVRISSMAEKSIKHDRVQKDIVVDPEVSAPNWVAALEGIAQESNMLQGMEILVGAGQVTLGGLLDSQADYNVLVRRVNQFAGDHALTFVNKIGIIPASAANFTAVSSPVLDRSTPTASSFGANQVEIDEASNVDKSPVVDAEPETGGMVVPQDSPHPESGLAKLDLKNGERGAPTLSAGDEVPEAGECQRRMDQALITNPITFLPNIANLSVDNYKNISDIGQIIAECPTFFVKIEGHTDSRGNPESNLALSADRATSVMHALTAKGLDLEKVSATGYGSARPVATNDTPEGRGLNRRIEIIFTEGP